MIVGALASVGSASAMLSEGDFNPYVGADYYQVWMKGNNVPGQSTFPKSYPGWTIYVGNKFTEYFGLELGYDDSVKAKKSWSTTSDLNGNTKIRRTGGHLDLVGFLPIDECANLIGSIGYGWVKPKVSTSINNPTKSATEADALQSISGKGESVFRIGVGADWMATDMFGLRAKLGWESTNSLRIKGDQNFTNLKYNTKAFKSSVTLAVGAFVKF